MPRRQAEVLLAVESAWSPATSTQWTPNNPARGQCSVTALVLHEMLGGHILKTRVGEAWHFYNELEGERLDLTASQFPAPIAYEDIASDSAEAMSDTTEAQLAALRAVTHRAMSAA